MHTIQVHDAHRWLHKLVGDWSYEAEAVMEPGQPPRKLAGRETVRRIGDLWVQLEGEGEMPDGSRAATIMTLGYDPERQRHVGTWIGSMMPQMWIYEGELDASGRILTLGCEGPDMSTPGRTTRYRDVIELKDDGHRTLTPYMLDKDDQWQQLMKVDYRRTV